MMNETLSLVLALAAGVLLASNMYDSGDLNGAMERLNNVESLCRMLHLGDATGEKHRLNKLAQAIAMQALILDSRGGLDGAIVKFEEAEQICLQSSNWDTLSGTLYNHAVILRNHGDMVGASAKLEEAERVCRRSGELERLPCILNNRAGILYKRGDLVGAMALYKEEEQIYRQAGELNELSGNLNNQVVILQDRGDLYGTMTLYKEIIFKRLTVREAEAYARKIAQDKVRKKALIDPELIEMENKLKESLGTRVSIEKRENGGRITIDYFTEQDIHDFLQKISSNGILPVTGRFSENNLISNAVKYNRPNGKVDIFINKIENKVTIEVSDTGIGLSKSETDKLFNEFVRIKNSKTKNILGSGLGLSTVKKIALIYKGDISVDSQPDIGSKFTIIMEEEII